MAYPAEYEGLIEIANDPQNITSQVRKIFLLEDPSQGSTEEQDRAYQDLERLSCEYMKDLLNYMNDFKVLAAKTRRMYISPELSEKFFRKMPPLIGKELEKAFYEKHPGCTIAVEGIRQHPNGNELSSAEQNSGAPPWTVGVTAAAQSHLCRRQDQMGTRPLPRLRRREREEPRTTLSLKDAIAASSLRSLPLSSLYPLKPRLRLPFSASKLLQAYPSVFSPFQPSHSLPLHVRLTPQAAALHREEQAVHNSLQHRDGAVERLTKLLMLAGAMRLPLGLIDKFKFDLGLPHNYISSLLTDYPEYFDVYECEDSFTGEGALGLELVSWRERLAVSEMERRAADCGGCRVTKGLPLRFSVKFPNGFHLEKKVMSWVEKWQALPYISPYENAFHLGPTSDQAERWTVAVLHELLWLLVSKKTDTENVFVWGQYLGFGNRFKKALKHHPRIFYISNKIRTQTVVLREAYSKDFLMEKHPLMGMRYRYIHLMHKSERWKKADVVSGYKIRQWTSPILENKNSQIDSVRREEQRLELGEESCAGSK